MKQWILILYAALFVFAPPAASALHFGFLESGSWSPDGSLSNRLDLRLYGPWGLSLRGQVTDRRPSPPWDHPDEGLTSPGAALYHKGTGSRFLFGILETHGLLTRTRNVWSRSAPWFETHSVSNADLKNTPQDMKNSAAYISLVSPALGPFTPYFSSSVGLEHDYSFQGGLHISFPSLGSALRAEAAFAETRLAEQKVQAWFSEKTFLQERNLQFYAGSLVLSHPNLSLAADYAYSEVFSWGKDLYFNGALRAAYKNYALSLAADGAGSRFSGSDGSVPGAGFRSAGKIEVSGARNMLFRASSTLRAAAWQKPFDRSATVLYFRFPLDKKQIFRVTRVSFQFKRDAALPERIDDSLDLDAVFALGPLRPALGLTLHQRTAARPKDPVIAYPDWTADHDFESLKLHAGLSCPIFLFSLSAAADYTIRAEKDALLTTSFGASVSGKLGRFGVKIANFTDSNAWSLTFSWRLAKVWE
jgi:hypothetical protein